ncbi:MAG: DUF1573 domain-containing protein, partial [Odoribacter splanchnicus]
MKPRKIYWTIGLLFILLSSIVSAFFILQPDYDLQAMNALPTTIRFEQDTLQLGTVRYGEKRKVTFRFTNTGQVPLLLRDVRPSCGCTGAECEKRPVDPGK